MALKDSGMRRSRLAVAFLHCFFICSSMSFRNSRIRSSLLRSCRSKGVASTHLINLNPGRVGDNKPYCLNGIRQFSKLPMSTKTEPDAVEVTDDMTAEDLFGFDLPTNENSQNLLRVRHTTAHIMAMAVQKLHPEAQVTIGPWIDQG